MGEFYQENYSKRPLNLPVWVENGNNKFLKNTWVLVIIALELY